MVYDWENKEEICYRMYIEEKKSLEEIMEYMKTEHKFAPSKRAFQTQFKRWDFPSKQNPAHKNAALVQRVKELWDCNTSQREMLRLLNEEGFDIKERELMRVRAKNRWLLRVPNGMKSNTASAGKNRENSDQDVVSQLQAALYGDADVEEDGEMEELEMPATTPKRTRVPSPPLSPEVMAKRQERLSKLQAESAERWATRKRRRRTRGWAGLPADPPGPPRFPSETTIDESKAFLNLDIRLYRDTRSRFQRICEEAGIIKKTIAGPERWEAAKDRLIQESSHLQTVFWASDENQEAKKLALDVVCSDVTKRMRTLERRMTIAEAKNALGINPEESRQLRNAFYQVLKADHFTSKLEAGEEHWKELKAQWINGSDLLQNILAPGDADPQHQEKVKAMEVLCRDVMKRLRDDQTKRDPTRKKKFDPSFSAQDEPMNFDDSTADASGFQTSTHEAQALAQVASQAQAQAQSPIQAQPQSQPRPAGARGQATLSRSTRQAQPQAPQQPAQMLLENNADLQIDPSLLLAAANFPSQTHHQFVDPQQQQQQQQQHTHTHFSSPSAAAFSTSPSSAMGGSLAVYFRLHPASEITVPTSRLWVSTLSSVSVEELKMLAGAKFAGMIAVRIEGVIKGEGGAEMTLPIEGDDELEAYLAAIQSVKPMFAVQLVNGWKNG